MLRHSTRVSALIGLSAQLRFGAAAILLVGLVACSKSTPPLEARGGANAGGATRSTPAPNGNGGFNFVDDLEQGGAAGTGGSAGAGDAGAPAPYVLPPSVTIGEAGEALCGGTPCACNNGVDDDDDGRVDGFDDECTGALDNDEGTFSTGVPGDNSDPKWQDCFFDGNSGAGDDQCRYHADCLSGEKPASDPDCAVSTTCRDFCAARTPNGCDCFGCCTVELDDSSSVSVFIGASCSMENVGDPASCPRCTSSTACGNTCGECELCPGKGVEDLPASCAEAPGSGGAGGGGGGADTPPYACDAGQTVCNETGDCPGGYYCSLGCCLAFVIY